MFKSICFFLILVFISSYSFADCNLKNLQITAEIIAQRENLMQYVAANKWLSNKTQSVTAYNAQQEIAVLTQIYNNAKQYKLAPYSTMLFSQILMDVSKQIEAYWLTYWNNSATSLSVKPHQKPLVSLKQLRSQIKSIDKQLLLLFTQHAANLPQCSASQIQNAFNKALKPIKGIPQQPSFINLLAAAFSQVKAYRAYQ